MIAKLALPGAWMWSRWQPDRGMPFNSYFFETPAGGVAIDPLSLDDGAMQALRERGGVKKIIVTNPEHARASEDLRQAFDAAIVHSAAEGEELFEGAFALPLAHGKSPEFAIHLRDAQAAVVGDAIIGAPAGALSVLPAGKVPDPKALAGELRKLWALRLDTLLVGDGYPVFAGADALIGDLLYSLLGPELFRMNAGALPRRAYKRHGKYQAIDVEVGLPIGARRLGYRIAELEPGSAFCPLHWHVESEELLYVLAGRPSVRMTGGTLLCEPGDFVALPAGERGAHQVLNESAEACSILLLGTEPAHESCFYPDSRKVLVEVSGGPSLMVRSEPALQYFDGE